MSRGRGSSGSGECPAVVLERWRENLAMLAANPGPRTDRTIMRLGTRLALERGKVLAYTRHTVWLAVRCLLAYVVWYV